MFDLHSFALGFHLVAGVWSAREWLRSRDGYSAFVFWWSVAFASFAALCVVTA